jgi:hypothetical protein
LFEKTQETINLLRPSSKTVGKHYLLMEKETGDDVKVSKCKVEGIRDRKMRKC